MDDELEQPFDLERPSPLDLDAEQMRRLGYWVVDAVVDHFEHRADLPALRTGRPDDLREALGGPVPEAPSDPLQALELLREAVFTHMQHGDHPRYFARIPGPSSFAGVLGDWLGTGFNAIASSWTGGSGPAAVELVALEWLRELLRMPAGTEGIILSGGSMANLTGLAAARQAMGQGAVYLSDQTHASIVRDLRALGYAPGEIRVLDSDPEFRLDPDSVAAAIAEDRGTGRGPTVVVATAGTTNCGAADPLSALADLCESEGLWLHVDGAYGGPAAFCDAGRSVLRGIERADSVVLDPHKWLFQPYDIGCLLVRRPGALAETFAMHPEYLADATAAAGEVDLRDRSLELTRRARGLKLWLALRTYGMARIRDAIARGIELARYAEGVLQGDPRWQVVTPAQLGIVTFVLRGASAQEHATSAAALSESGFAAVSTTTLRGQLVLRLCTINPATTCEDIDLTLERLAAGIAQPAGATHPPRAAHSR